MDNQRVSKFMHGLAGLLVSGLCLAVLHGARVSFGAEKPFRNEVIHESVIAGTWYPGSQEELVKTIRSFLNNVSEISFPGRLSALISPHAGYEYSGQVAAHAYKLLEKERFDTAVVIGPSHHALFSGAGIYDRGGFRTPLGVVPLDYELISALEKREPRIRNVTEAHSKEHSVEMQIPFLQVVMPQFKLVPLVMGDQDFETCKWLAEAIAESTRGKSVLVVASSDLSHFHSDKEAKRLDQVVIDRVSALDPQGLNDALKQEKCSACGGGPIITAMLIARMNGADLSKVLKYANSGDITGDRSRVVGYMAAALGSSKELSTALKDDSKNATHDSGYSADEKAFLHKIAMDTIEAVARGDKPPTLDATPPILKEPRGAFVTLRKHGELRGCIGRIIADKPLNETVEEMSEAAAFHDPRFRPVTQDELRVLQIEISVLTPFKKITNTNEIRVGVHGLYVRKGGQSGLLLPQVATEFGWDRDTFLENLCRKASLPKDAWKDKDTDIFVFSADIF